MKWIKNKIAESKRKSKLRRITRKWNKLTGPQKAMFNYTNRGLDQWKKENGYEVKEELQS